MVLARFQRNTTKFTTWVPPPLSFSTPSIPRRTSLIDFGSYKSLNPRIHELLAGHAVRRRRKEGCARCAAYKSLLLEHCGLSSYTTQSFLLSPKSYGNSFHGVGLFLRCTLWQSMVLLLCPARLQNPKSVQSMAPAVLPKLPLVIP